MIPTLKIAFNVWTHAGDQDMVGLCVSSIRKFHPNCPIFIWNDANKSIDENTRQRLFDAGCEVQDTFYERVGRLRGERCHACMVENFSESAANVDYVAKIDPDTLFVNNNLGDFLEGNNYVCQTSGGGLAGVYGFYCFKKELLPAIQRMDRQSLVNFAAQNNIHTTPLFLIDDFFFAASALYVFGTGVSFLPRGVLWKTGQGFSKEGFLSRKNSIVLYDFGTPTNLRKDRQLILNDMEECLRLS